MIKLTISKMSYIRVHSHMFRVY